MRSKACLALAFGFGSLLVPQIAAAQNRGGAAAGNPHGPSRSSTQFTLRREEAGGADAQIARSRARAGDCAGSLAGFDAAINKSIEPTLRRDRGLCHEKLGHPFPAIDDYRAYLTARPDAPDSDQIRQRLAALEEQAGVGGPSSQAVKDDGSGSGASGSASASASGDDGGGSAEASGSVSIGSGGASSKGSSKGSSKSAGARRADASDDGSASGKGFDYYAAQEKKADDAENSPLRYGEGFIIGAFLHFPRYFFAEGGTSDPGYGVGATLRYALGGSLTLVSEFGFAGIGTGGQNTSSSGPLLMAGAEIKIPISRYASDQILLKGGLGYERYTATGTRIATNTLLGRFAAGYRHVFGTSLALDLLVDGGPAFGFPEQGDSTVAGFVGASAALLVAF